MPNLNTQGARIVDPVLTNVAQGFQHPEHVGSALFPRVPVTQRGGQVIEFGKESFKRYNLRRAPGANTAVVQFGYLGKPFALVQDSLDVPVPREHQQDAAAVPGIDLGARAVNVGMNTLSLALEDEQAQLARDASQYDANHKVALTTGSLWNESGGDPSGDIKAAREAVRSSVGMYANTVLLSAKAFEAARDHASIVDRFKYTSRDSITAEMLAQLWDVEKVVVGKGVIFDDGGAAADIWGNDVVVAYVPSIVSAIEQPSYGYTYTLTGNPLVEKPFWDNSKKSWMFGTTYERAPVLSGITSGFLIQNTTG